MVKLNHSIVRDFLSLITNRGLDSLISIVIVPYLLSKIGNIEYGKIIVAQSIACIGVAIINYGTDLLMLQRCPNMSGSAKGPESPYWCQESSGSGRCCSSFSGSSFF